MNMRHMQTGHETAVGPFLAEEPPMRPVCARSAWPCLILVCLAGSPLVEAADPFPCTGLGVQIGDNLPTCTNRAERPGILCDVGCLWWATRSRSRA